MVSSVCVEVQMLIRRSVTEVFQAFIDPAVTTNFWFTKSDGRLETGKTVTWTWEMYQVSTQVYVRQIIENQLIAINWDDPVTAVDFEFQPLKDDTYVTIRNYGFDKTGDELITALVNNTGGFTTVLDGLKAYLEHGIRLNLIADKFPHAVVRQKTR